MWPAPSAAQAANMTVPAAARSKSARAAVGTVGRLAVCRTVGESLAAVQHTQVAMVELGSSVGC